MSQQAFKVIMTALAWLAASYGLYISEHVGLLPAPKLVLQLATAAIWLTTLWFLVQHLA